MLAIRDFVCIIAPFFVCSTVLGANTLNDNATKEIKWIRWDDPPIFVFNGPFAGKGVLDTAQRIIEQAMPQYKHTTIDGNVPGVLAEAQRKSEICNAGWLDTPEWSKLFYFSKPIFVIPSNGILLKRSRLKEVEKLKPYRLQKFLDKKSEWKLGIGRLYGEGIDEVLFKNNYKNNPKIVNIDSSLKVHKMIQKDRIQYTLGYPFEAVYYNKLLSTDDPVLHLPVEDNEPFTNVVVACPRSPWGQKIIADVDKAISNKELLIRITNGVDKWLVEDDRRNLITPRRNMLKKYYSF